MVRIVLFGILVVGGITSVVLQDREKRGFTLVLFVVGTVMFEIFTNYLSDWMRPVFFGPDPAASVSASVSAELTRTGEDTGPVQADVKPVELDSQGSGQTSSPVPAPAPSPARPLRRRSLIPSASWRTSADRPRFRAASWRRGGRTSICIPRPWMVFICSRLA